MPRYGFYHFPWFDDWLEFSGAIPSIYWNVYSEEQRYKFLCKRLQMLVEYASKMGMQLNLQGDAINELAEELANFKETFADDFEEYYKQRICQWLNDNLICMIGQAAKFVQFGLTDDGYMAIHIPFNWDFLEFYTPMEYDNQETYGKLCIKY